MENLGKKSREFLQWIEQYKIITSDKLDCEPEDVEIKIEALYEYFKAGCTPTQCLMEDWGIDG